MSSPFDPALIHPADRGVNPRTKARRFNPAYGRLMELRKRFESVARSMGDGPVLLWRLREHLAGNVPWLRIGPERRNEVIVAAWKEKPAPRWIAHVEEEAPAGRLVRRGEHPPFPACGPAHPREMFHLAERDHEDELRWRQRESEGKVTQSEWSDHVNHENQDKMLGRGLRDRSPTGQETMAFKLNWNLTDDEMVAAFRTMVGLWRPDAWKEFATVRLRNLAVENALIQLSAYRYEPKVRASNTADDTRTEFWSKYPKIKPTRNSRSEEALFSTAVAAARRQLAAWKLCCAP
jgi:hypothetical protein